MFSQRCHKLSAFKTFFLSLFSFSDFYSSFSPLTLSSVSSLYCWFLQVYFFISVTVLFSAFWVVFIFFNSVKILSSSLLFPSLLNIFMIITFKPLSGRLFIFTSFSFFLWFYLVPLFGTYSSLPSSCLTFCVYFYVLGRLCLPMFEMWPYLGGFLWGPAAHSPLVTRALCSLCSMWQHVAFCCGRADYCWLADRQGWSLARLVARPCLVWWLLVP